MKKLCSIILIFILLISQYLGIFVSVVYAASSPFSQSNWTAGDFSSSSNVVTSTPNQLTLTNSEKLTNTGFETDLSSWTSGETTTFHDSSFLANSSSIASWPLDDTVTTQSYARVTNPGVASGRNIVINGGFTADTDWTKASGITIASGVAHFDGTETLNNGLTQTIPIITGKEYTVTYTVSNYVQGSITALAGGNTTGLIHAANGTFTETQVMASGSPVVAIVSKTVGTGFIGDIDNVSVTQLSIPASQSAPTQLLVDGDMETAGVGSWSTDFSPTLTKQTGTPHGGGNVLRIARNGTNNPDAYQAVMTVGSTYRVTGYARSDGSATPKVVDNNTRFTGTTSTSWQPFDVVFVATNANLYLVNQTSTGTQYVEFDDVVVSPDNYIRSGELVQDGNMEVVDSPSSWTDTDLNHYWTALNVTLSKQTSTPHGGSRVLRLAAISGSANAQQSIFNIGKTYRINGYAKSDGTDLPYLADGTNIVWTGTTSTSWQYFDITIVAPTTNFRLRTTGSSGYVEFDDVSVTEVDPLVGKPTNGVTLGSPSGGHLSTAYTFDGTNDNVNIYSSDLNSAFNPNEGTLVAWAKVSDAAKWTDGSTVTRRIIELGGSDANNRYIVQNGSGVNEVQFLQYSGSGSNNKSVSSAALGGTLGWFQVIMTWSKSNDQFKAYLNGVQVGTTQTGLGTWVGNLASNTVAIGATGSAGTNSWQGMINDVRLYNSALSDTQIALLYSGSTSVRDTSVHYSGSASSKLVSGDGYTGTFTESVNVGDTNQYNLVAYAYIDGSTAVDGTYASLYYNSLSVTTTYTSVGSGWYKLTGTVTGVASSVGAGVSVPGGKTVYVDDFSLNNYASSGTLTSNIFDSGPGGANWGTLTYAATTPTNTTATVKIRTSNNSDMSGATAFASCSAITNSTDISNNSCVTDSHRYVQYLITLANTDTTVTPTFTSFSLPFTQADVSPPTGGLITFTDGYYSATSVALTVNDGTDSGAGVDTTSRIIQRKSSTLSAGTCGAYGSFATITPSGSYPNYTDTAVSSGNCYQYQYLVSDLAPVPNQAIYSNANTAKIDTGAPTTPGTPSTTTPTNSTTQTWIFTAATDALSNIASYLWRTTGAGIFSGSSATNSVITNLTEGIYNFFVKAVDAAGNTGSESSGTVTIDTTVPDSLNLDSPDNNSYTNSQRPVFAWHESNTNAGLGKYILEISNNGSDIVVDNIEPSRSTDVVTNKYVIHYDANFISFYTKSSSDWGPNENDGKLKDGTVNWKVTAVDTAGNQTSSSRTLYVDTVAPVLSDVKVVGSTISGKLTDDFSSPDSVNIKIDSKNIFGGYNLFLNANVKVTSNEFTFTPDGGLPNGTYRITVTGKDKAGNQSNTEILNLSIPTGNVIVTPTVSPRPTQIPVQNQMTPTVNPTTSPRPTPRTSSVNFDIGKIIANIWNTYNTSINFVISTQNSVNHATASVFNSVGNKYIALVNYTNGVNKNILLTFDNGIKLTFNTVNPALAFVANTISDTYTNLAQKAPGVMRNTIYSVSSSLAIAGNGIGNIFNALGNTTYNLAFNIGGEINSAGISIINSTNKIANSVYDSSFIFGEKVQNVSDTIGLAIIQFTYNFVHAPTQISNVSVAEVSATTVKISWETNQPASGKVNYGLDTTYPLDVQSEKRTTHHEFVLNNLKPNTQYLFEVMSQGKNYVYDANRKFTTPASP